MLKKPGAKNFRIDHFIRQVFRRRMTELHRFRNRQRYTWDWPFSKWPVYQAASTTECLLFCNPARSLGSLIVRLDCRRNELHPHWKSPPSPCWMTWRAMDHSGRQYNGAN